MDAREALEKVLGLQRYSVLKAGGTAPTIDREAGPAILVSDIETLLKGLTEAGDCAGPRVMITYNSRRLHWESESCCHYTPTCTPADMNAPDARAWVARQRKDSHAG